MPPYKLAQMKAAGVSIKLDIALQIAAALSVPVGALLEGAPTPDVASVRPGMDGRKAWRSSSTPELRGWSIHQTREELDALFDRIDRIESED